MAGARPECEKEINHLVDLTEEYRQGEADVDVKRKKAVASLALTEWKESLRVLESKLSRRTKRVDCLTNEIYQLVGLYSVFLSVVFSAVVSDRVHCQQIWIPGVLCLIPCFVSIHFIDKRLSYIRLVRKDIADDELSRKNLSLCIANLKNKGYSLFNFSEDVKEKSDTISETDFRTWYYLRAALAVFLILLACALVHILCLTKDSS